MLCATGMYLRYITNTFFVIWHLNKSRLRVCFFLVIFFGRPVLWFVCMCMVCVCCSFSQSDSIWKVQEPSAGWKAGDWMQSAWLPKTIHHLVQRQWRDPSKFEVDVWWYPQRVAGDVYISCLSGISGLSFDSTLLSPPLFLSLVLLLFLSSFFCLLAHSPELFAENSSIFFVERRTFCMVPD